MLRKTALSHPPKNGEGSSGGQKTTGSDRPERCAHFPQHDKRIIEDEESCKIAGKVILQLFPDTYLMKISVSPSIYRPVLLPFAASVPHFPLTPRGVKADGAHLLRPLHGVDGQLPRGGGGADGGGIVHRVENRSSGKQCRTAHHVPPPQQKYPYLLHIEFAPFCHNLCGGGAEKKRRDRTPEKPLFAGLAP